MKILDELRRLRREATPLPWEWYAEDGSMVSLNTKGDPLEGHVLSSSLCNSCHARYKAGMKDQRCLMPKSTNAAYITAACNASEALELVARAAEVYVDRSNDANAFRLLAELEALARIGDDDAS